MRVGSMRGCLHESKAPTVYLLPIAAHSLSVVKKPFRNDVQWNRLTKVPIWPGRKPQLALPVQLGLYTFLLACPSPTPSLPQESLALLHACCLHQGAPNRHMSQ